MQEQVIDEAKIYTLEEYVKFDEIGPHRHDYLEGKLRVVEDDSIIHNAICLNLAFAIDKLQTIYNLTIESVKTKIEGENIYLYPDIALFKEQPFQDLLYEDYIIYQPLLIAEVLSDSTHKYDSTDKFILYQKISSLRYYLLVEPEKHLVIFYEKDDAGNWSSKPFTELEEIISLTLFDMQFSLAEIYK